MEHLSSRDKLLVTYLALSPCIWFASFRLGTLKFIVFTLLALTSVQMLLKMPRKVIFVFLLILSLVGLNLYLVPTPIDPTMFLLGIFEDMLLFTIGYCAFQNRCLDNKMILISLSLVFVGSVLSISNFFFDVPDWVSPAQVMIYNDTSITGFTMYPMWSTGLSFDRNGWGCSLALLLPLCFVIKGHKKLAVLLYVILFTSLFICANRNGLLATIIVLFLFYFKCSNTQKKVLLILLFTLGGAIIIGSSVMTSMLRLDSEDISSGRILQYLLIPQMLQDMGFWGMGHYGTSDYLELNGLGNHMLHNTYFKILIEYGWLVGIAFFALVLNIIKQIIKAFKSNKKESIVYSLILLAGLLTCLFEPQTVFGIYGGYSIFWICYGYLVYHNKMQSLRHYSV